MVYTQWCGVGPRDESEIQSDLAWLPIISAEISVFKNTSVQQGQAVLYDDSEGLWLGTNFWTLRADSCSLSSEPQ